LLSIIVARGDLKNPMIYRTFIVPDLSRIEKPSNPESSYNPILPSRWERISLDEWDVIGETHGHIDSMTYSGISRRKASFVFVNI